MSQTAPLPPALLPRSKLDYIGNLDGLRAVACLMVLWGHLPQVGDTALSVLIEKIKAISHPGQMGVNIFFVLSGFLITRILLNDKESGPSFKRFYAKRILRIFPLYFLVLGFLAIVDPAPALGWSAFYLQNYYFAFHTEPGPFRHTWSLAVEEHFYFLWPLLVYWTSREKSKWICSLVLPVIAILGGMATLWIFERDLADALLFRGTHFRLLPLSLGAALAYAEIEIRVNSRRRWQNFAFGLVLFSVMLLLLPKMVAATAPYFGFLSSLASVFIASAIVVLALVYSKIKFAPFRILEWRLLRFIGVISYGLYTYHYVIYYYFLDVHEDRLREPISILFALTLIVSVMFISIMSYYFVERPLINLKRHLH